MSKEGGRREGGGGGGGEEGREDGGEWERGLEGWMDESGRYG